MAFANNTSYIIYFIAALTIILSAVSIYAEYRKAKKLKSNKKLEVKRYKKVRRVAVLIASKNGEKTIAATVRGALANNCDVFVVSDGSTDKTISKAWKAGAIVHGLKDNVGKPAALYNGYKYFKLGEKYDYG
jgi:cellulose synthase/poly-beta-1,6-N-acetylglucosamine synthase-like glycosyltransferase